jgi:hypothetical protein
MIFSPILMTEVVLLYEMDGGVKWLTQRVPGDRTVRDVHFRSTK